MTKYCAQLWDYLKNCTNVITLNLTIMVGKLVLAQFGLPYETSQTACIGPKRHSSVPFKTYCIIVQVLVQNILSQQQIASGSLRNWSCIEV